MNLYLLRHGETVYNRDGLGLGRLDVALTERGEQQTAAAAARMAGVPLDRIFTSPLSRARRLAEAIGGERGIAVEPRDELLELDVGLTEGMTFRQMREEHAEFLQVWAGDDGLHMPMPGGESLGDVAARLALFAAELRTLDAKSVAVVSHNFVTKLLICELLGLEPGRWRTFSVDVASLCTLRLQNGRATVQAINDCCHLDSLNVDVNTRSL
ncbi:MAG: histidine phosphatase family protein [Dehalococcoidia bacterium]|nr:histidine phosphatase family protein [Dehalococcoidia bacterium]